MHVQHKEFAITQAAVQVVVVVVGVVDMCRIEASNNAVPTRDEFLQRLDAWYLTRVAHNRVYAHNKKQKKHADYIILLCTGEKRNERRGNGGCG